MQARRPFTFHEIIFIHKGTFHYLSFKKYKRERVTNKLFFLLNYIHFCTILQHKVFIVLFLVLFDHNPAQKSEKQLTFLKCNDIIIHVVTSASAGTGRQARLRGVCCMTYGFKSRLAHQGMVLKYRISMRFSGLFFLSVVFHFFPAYYRSTGE